MKILAIETSTLFGGVAIMDDMAGLLIEIRLNIETTHSERLMAQIDHALKQTGLTPSEIDAFAVTIGPGSFTGLRIGLSTVKGFSYAMKKPIVTIPTLDALAWHFPFSEIPVCPLLDARKHEVYAGLFRWDGDGFRKDIAETSLTIKTLADQIQSLSLGKVFFTGEGSLLYKESILKHMENKAIFAPAEKIAPSPAVVASLAMKKALAGDYSEPITLVPRYIRKSEAEIKWRERNS